MSFSLYVWNLSPEQVAFSYSAAHETMMALHVFHDCKHHPLHIPWVIDARRKINSTLKQEIEAFSFLYKRPLVTFWALQGNSAFQSFEEGLRELESSPVEFFYTTIVETILNRKMADGQLLQQEFVEFACNRYPESEEIINALVKKPEPIKQRFLNMLEEFWRICVKEDWNAIEELFLKDIADRGRTLMKDGALQLLGSLSQEIDIDPGEQKAIIRRISKEDIFFDKDDELLLTPSYFAWPHLFVNLHPTVGINYSIMENEQEGARPMPPEDLLKFFSTLGDFSRLQIVKYLAQQPRSTRELAGLMGMTEGAISKHIKLLKDAGLVKSKRESYYVFYHLLDQPFHDFPQGLAEYLKQS
jgi:DNA-binding transcriptional ArsR family regulator